MQAKDIASGIADAVSHPLTVEVINQGPGIWGNVATGLITAGAAIGAVMLTHKFTLRREKSASEEKQQRERYFIATELVFLLEQFAEGCASVARDNGLNMSMPSRHLIPCPNLTMLLSPVTGAPCPSG